MAEDLANFIPREKIVEQASADSVLESWAGGLSANPTSGQSGGRPILSLRGTPRLGAAPDSLLVLNQLVTNSCSK